MVHALAAILEEQNQPLALRNIEIPPLKNGQVLVKIAYSGFCHSQLNEIKGRKGPDPFLPHTLGHEGSGTVLDVGPQVSKVKKGDRVVLTWIKGEGLDVPSCKYGAVNSGAISTFLTHAVISENRLVPIPKEMPLREAALLGCAIPTGAGVVRHEMQLKENQSLALFGIGGVGLSALLAAKVIGAHPLIAVDLHEEKLLLAKKLGATHTINAAFEDPVDSIQKITGSGVDFSFESAGSRPAMEAAFCSLKAPGKCVLAGNLPKGEKIQIDPFELIRGKQIVGTWGGKSSIDADVAFYIEAYLSKKLPLEPLITHEFPLEKINELVALFEQGKVGRALISLNPN